jgi:uncharacterized protein YjlB
MIEKSDERIKDAIRKCRVVHHILKDDGIYPNNEQLPLLAYQGAVKLPIQNPANIFEILFETNQWGGSWRNGVYGHHHYHSTAHEVLGVFRGTAEIQFGGEKGIMVTVNGGDVVIIPAGVSHKKLSARSDFSVVGAYPFGQQYDMCYGKSGERPQVDQNIASVLLPKSDPIYGLKGPLIDYWYKKD